MDKYLIVIVCGVVAGFLSRWIMLRSDYRHYPTYPHGQLIHLALGFIAASLGAVAVPAIMKPDYTAVTFLVLAAQQFRDVRNMERENLSKLEETKLIRRGMTILKALPGSLKHVITWSFSRLSYQSGCSLGDGLTHF